MPLLTKSKYMSGLGCPRLLWVLFNQPDMIPKVDEATQFTFKQGQLVGEYAKKLYPAGIDIPYVDFMSSIHETENLLNSNKPLFEASIRSGDLYSRVDILCPNGTKWDIIEVKGTTSVKAEHIDDVSFQRHCLELKGLEVERCLIAHINGDYYRDGEIVAEELFTLSDVTEDVVKASEGIEERIEGLFEVISNGKIPDISYGQHCKSPYGCSLKGDCWSPLPDNSILSLSRGGKKSFKLLNDGFPTLSDIPSDVKLSQIQSVQVRCDRDKCRNIDIGAIRAFLSDFIYPVHYLDFETFSTAIPLLDDSKPYQQIPFQFSLHICDELGAEPVHHMFLAEGGKDPRKDFLEELMAHIRKEGSIIAYNKSFEIGRMKELAKLFPDNAPWISELNERFIDLWEPFRKFSFYDPAQNGSASIKSVLPAVTGKGYCDMGICDGATASRKYLDIAFGGLEGVLPEEDEIQRVRDDLEKYCCLDTLGMVWIVEELGGMGSED